jgi:hypothetical protein
MERPDLAHALPDDSSRLALAHKRHNGACGAAWQLTLDDAPERLIHPIPH